MTKAESYVRHYFFDPYGEAIRGGLAAALTEGAQILFRLDPDKVTDWRSWAISAGVAIAQAAVHYGFGKVPPPTAAPVATAKLPEVKP